mmetsp:Transcript_42386/g.90528  ORF Transcript_42386/g.90528 Transcript_42386/m.90528 type:complete len:214 (-) Transcript_42386:300-941(-)
MGMSAGTVIPVLMGTPRDPSRYLSQFWTASSTKEKKSAISSTGCARMASTISLACVVSPLAMPRAAPVTALEPASMAPPAALAKPFTPRMAPDANEPPGSFSATEAAVFMVVSATLSTVSPALLATPVTPLTTCSLASATLLRIGALEKTFVAAAAPALNVLLTALTMPPKKRRFCSSRNRRRDVAAPTAEVTGFAAALVCALALLLFPAAPT